jgi:hypothetical protein
MFHQRLHTPPSMPTDRGDGALHDPEEGFRRDSLDLLLECQALGCGLGNDLLGFMPSVETSEMESSVRTGWVRRLLGF